MLLRCLCTNGNTSHVLYMLSKKAKIYFLLRRSVMLFKSHCVFNEFNHNLRHVKTQTSTL